MEHCITTSSGRTHKLKFVGPKLGLCYFLMVASLYFLDIAQDCSLGQYLISSRAETSKKYLVAKIGSEMIFSIPMSVSVHSNLVVY